MRGRVRSKEKKDGAHRTYSQCSLVTSQSDPAARQWKRIFL